VTIAAAGTTRSIRFYRGYRGVMHRMTLSGDKDEKIFVV
jgi:hypothetical protein